MSVTTEINRIKNAVAEIRSAFISKGIPKLNKFALNFISDSDSFTALGNDTYKITSDTFQAISNVSFSTLDYKNYLGDVGTVKPMGLLLMANYTNTNSTDAESHFVQFEVAYGGEPAFGGWKETCTLNDLKNGKLFNLTKENGIEDNLNIKVTSTGSWPNYDFSIQAFTFYRGNLDKITTADKIDDFAMSAWVTKLIESEGGVHSYDDSIIVGVSDSDDIYEIYFNFGETWEDLINRNASGMDIGYDTSEWTVTVNGYWLTGRVGQPVDLKDFVIPNASYTGMSYPPNYMSTNGENGIAPPMHTDGRHLLTGYGAFIDGQAVAGSMNDASAEFPDKKIVAKINLGGTVTETYCGGIPMMTGNALYSACYEGFTLAVDQSVLNAELEKI